jgi:hypothetical protein
MVTASKVSVVVAPADAKKVAREVYPTIAALAGTTDDPTNSVRAKAIVAIEQTRLLEVAEKSFCI